MELQHKPGAFQVETIVPEDLLFSFQDFGTLAVKHSHS